MKKDTKQDILKAARRLFNESGYNSVSLRDIAKAVGISKGNLTYHFSKKEEIMENLIAQSKDTFPADAPQTLKDWDAAFLDMQQAVQQNLYFFLHYTQLSQTSPEICRKQSARYDQLCCRMRTGLLNLHESGMLRDELFDSEYSRLIDTLYMAVIYWAPLSKLKQSIGMETVEYRRHAWSIMYPFLTEKGRAGLQDIIEI